MFKQGGILRITWAYLQLCDPGKMQKQLGDWGSGMPRINAMFDLVTQLSSPYITVHQDRCQLVRNRNADCLRCASVCTSGCIDFDGEELHISPEKCIGCGTCATICPTCCLEAHHPNDAEFINTCRSAQLSTGGVVVIACAELLERAQGLYDEEKVVRVECLGRVEEAALTTLAAEGAHEIVLVRGDCEQCAHASGWNMALEVLATEKELLQAWNCPVNIRIAQKMPAVCRAEEIGYDKAKRAAFIESGEEVSRMGALVADYALRDAVGAQQEDHLAYQRRSYTKVMEDGTLPHFLPDRRERLLDALASLGEPNDVMIATRLWGHVIINPEICTSCQMCATFCPTGALRKFGQDDGSGEDFGVEHYPGDCVKCRCCENICPAGAIEISEEVFARDMLAGMTDRYVMKPKPIKRSGAHTILEVQRMLIDNDQVYER